MKLRLRQTLASRWSNVAKLIGLSDSKIANIQKNNRDVEDCIDEVMKCWIEDAPNLSCYKCTWDGMCKLLVDLELSSQSEVLKEAIKAEQSTLRGNFTEGNLFFATMYGIRYRLSANSCTLMFAIP